MTKSYRQEVLDNLEAQWKGFSERVELCEKRAKLCGAHKNVVEVCEEGPQSELVSLIAESVQLQIDVEEAEKKAVEDAREKVKALINRVNELETGK